jgi:hypothetical protein
MHHFYHSVPYLHLLYEELEQVFDQFTGYRINILLEDFNAKVVTGTFLDRKLVMREPG